MRRAVPHGVRHWKTLEQESDAALQAWSYWWLASGDNCEGIKKTQITHSLETNVILNDVEKDAEGLIGFEVNF